MVQTLKGLKPVLPEEEKEQSRRKRERIIMVITSVVVIAITFWETKVLRTDFPFSTTQRVILFALVNINVILLLLLIFLVVRNLFKLFLERKRKILGSKIRTKLVLGFVTLSLIPTIVLFVIAFQFMTTGMDYWFTIHLERSLEDSLDVGKAYYRSSQRGNLIYAQQISQDLGHPGTLSSSDPRVVQKFLQDKSQEYGLSWAALYLPNMERRFQVVRPEAFIRFFQEPSLSFIQKGFRPSGVTDIQSTSEGDFFIAGVPVWDKSQTPEAVAVLVAVSYFPKSLMKKMDAISSGLEGYRQMQLLKNPIKFTYLIILSIVTLLIIFSATWFGFYLAKGITIPIQKLAEGTFRVAQGDYNFTIDLEAKDEFGVLVNSFNRMTADLKDGQSELERINEELRKSNEEINQRRRYMETILANIGAGVISVDAVGRISIINTSAKEMLNIKTEKVLGRPYREVLRPEHFTLVQDFVGNLDGLKKGTLERSLQIPLRDRTLTLLVKITLLRDEEGRYLGMVIVFDDLTEIEKIQKVSAWREVARRLAHEIKNPLTPIKLSAQRLRKKYLDKLPDGREVFDDCTQIIINQVDELTRLVNEFFVFARLPAVTLTRNDLNYPDSGSPGSLSGKS